MTIELTEAFASSQGEVRWARLGDGPPVVLVHGWPFSSWIWRDVAAGLAARQTVYVWDLPAYGRSERRANQDVTLDGHARVFAELLAHWSLDTGPRPSVVAHDIGGAVALRAHLVHGMPYARLALVDAVAIAPWGSGFFRLVRDAAGTFAQIPLALHAALVRGYIDDGGGPALSPAAAEALAGPWLDDAGRAAFYRQIAALRQEHTDEIEDRYARLDLPVLVCWGTEDAWLPAERGRALAGRIPGARLRLIEGAGHLVPVHAPAALTGELLTWLDRTAETPART
jgi:pimeloyl-ACP methyl ester carboxylesterase